VQSDNSSLERDRLQRRRGKRLRLVQDRWGFSWQITPRVLLDATTSPDPAAAKRAFEAMMPMKKIDVAAIEAALRGETVDA
jgi:predicted 3-demethylubiquinone-9 3-methyltransferase (glyoxalase superfamily)